MKSSEVAKKIFKELGISATDKMIATAAEIIDDEKRSAASHAVEEERRWAGVTSDDFSGGA